MDTIQKCVFGWPSSFLIFANEPKEVPGLAITRMCTMPPVRAASLLLHTSVLRRLWYSDPLLNELGETSNVSKVGDQTFWFTQLPISRSTQYFFTTKFQSMQQPTLLKLYHLKWSALRCMIPMGISSSSQLRSVPYPYTNIFQCFLNSRLFRAHLCAGLQNWTQRSALNLKRVAKFE